MVSMAGSRPAQEDELYDELSRINNELVNARRELTKRNVELTRSMQRRTSFSEWSRTTCATR